MAEPTQSAQAYNEVSRRIFLLEVPPGERIIGEFWGDKLGVNRSAIREALIRLLG